MIDITPRTVEILKNFCTINKSIVIKPGNQIATLSINKNILAIADVEETFDSEIAIYDLGMFINGLTLLDQPKINTVVQNHRQTKQFCKLNTQKLLQGFSSKNLG